MLRTLVVGGSSRRVGTIVFDVDGTLVDSNDAHAEAWQRSLAAFGFELPFAKIRGLIGKGSDKLVPELTGIEAGTPAYEELTAARSKLFAAEFIHKIKALPGARELLVALQRRGLTFALASGAKEDELRAILRAAGLACLFDAQTSADDAPRAKPDPDIVLAALKRAGTPRDEALMIGDTPYDVQAATRAGIPIVALRCGGYDDEDLDGALAVYDDPRALLGALTGAHA